MIRTLIVDDESHCLATLEILLKEYCPQVQIAGQCRSAARALELVENTRPDLVFLDIEMPGMNGFEMLEKIEMINFAVIFTTSYDQYAIKAFRFSALDYLLKPMDPDELVAAVKKVEEQRPLPLPEQYEMLLRQIAGKRHQFTKVAVPTLEGFEMIPAEAIVRCSAENNYTHLYLRNGSRIVACRTLKEMEHQLQDFSNFIRVHYSYMVNLNEVIKYFRGDGGYLLMSDGSHVNVSKSRKDALMNFFNPPPSR